MAIIKFINNKVSLRKTINYICKEEKTTNKLISGKDCIAENAYEEMITIKKQFNKLQGREKIHFVQSFNPKDNVNYEMAHEIGVKLAEYFKGFQVVVATHQDTNHIHNHLVINTVNFETGKKFHQSKKDLEEIKKISNKLCLEYGLSIPKKKSKVDDIKINEYKVRQNSTSWKLKLESDIDKSMELANNKYEFIREMNKLGYKVTWTKERKNITYTTPAGMKCRDRKLHNEKYLKENMEKYFKEKQIRNIKGYKKQTRHIQYLNMSLNLAEIIKQFKRINEQEQQTTTNISYNQSAKRQFAMEMHYSLEELEDMEM